MNIVIEYSIYLIAIQLSQVHLACTYLHLNDSVTFIGAARWPSYNVGMGAAGHLGKFLLWTLINELAATQVTGMVLNNGSNFSVYRRFVTS